MRQLLRTALSHPQPPVTARNANPCVRPAPKHWLAAGLCCLALVVMPVRGEFPQPYNTEPDTASAPLPPELAAQRLRLPDGFHATVFAAEPDVQNPIAMAWDSRGRLWIAENYTYAERTQQFALDLQDRVLIFDDTDGDGHFNSRSVFLDTVQRLTSVEVGHGGVWLMCPPQLLFVPDRNHDDQPDGPAEIVLDGFTVGHDNYHNFANGLRWGPDGWLYGRCGGSCPGQIGPPGTPDQQRHLLAGGIWRYHPTSGRVEVLNAGTTNPWGHDWNEFGEGFFINTVNGHLWHLIPGSHLDRPFAPDPNPRVYRLLDQHADHWHFDTGKTWQQSRDGAANDYGGGHAHVGATIYLGDNWPDEFRGRLLTVNIHGRRINQEILRRTGSGYLAGHGQDFCISADPWFRGMELSYGPDGAVYLLDWSDTGECHESTGVHRTSGRIFRLHYGDNPGKRLAGDLRRLTDMELAELQRAKNEWMARQARLLLAERALAGTDLPAVRQRLDQWLQSTSDGSLAVRCLLTLRAIQATDDQRLAALLEHSHESVRAWAVRLLTDDWPLDGVLGPEPLPGDVQSRVAREAAAWLDQLSQLARSDPSGLVRLTLASTLQRLPVDMRPTLATALMSHAADQTDANLPWMVWYGLIPVADSNPVALADVVAAGAWSPTTRLIARRLTESIDQDPRGLNRLLTDAARVTDRSTSLDILTGMREALMGWQRASQPAAWDPFLRSLTPADDVPLQDLVRQLSALFGDGRALDDIQQVALDAQATIEARRAALQTLIDSRAPELRTICQELVAEPQLNVIAARGLAQFDDPVVARLLIAEYKGFREPQRPQIVSLLVARPSFAKPLLEAIAAGRIARNDVSAFQIRQLMSLGDTELASRASEVWGAVRESDAGKRQRIAELKSLLEHVTPDTTQLSQGRRLFQQTCSKCHRLYGVGEQVGPDLTGSGRSNLDYLLENIVDPSAVVDAAHRMSILTMVDGRVLNGLVTARTDRTVTLRTETESLTLDREAIDEIHLTTLSPMPEGLLDNMTPAQIEQLIAYLRHPSQVPLADEN